MSTPKEKKYKKKSNRLDKMENCTYGIYTDIKSNWKAVDTDWLLGFTEDVKISVRRKENL
jgi:hypothetical protein